MCLCGRICMIVTCIIIVGGMMELLHGSQVFKSRLHTIEDTLHGNFQKYINEELRSTMVQKRIALTCRDVFVSVV
ncbi:hypothetical protein GQ457_03G022630 [Hibiscus cannabinus]